MFRLFRWTMDYNHKLESRVTTVWIKLPGLPQPLFDSAYIEAIVSTFAEFLDVNDRTKACLSLRYARVCVEVDVTKNIPDKILIVMGGSNGFWQSIEIESKISYCANCKIHGHDLGSCRKSKIAQDTSLQKSGYGPDILFQNTAPVSIPPARAKRGSKAAASINKQPSRVSWHLPETKTTNVAELTSLPKMDMNQKRGWLLVQTRGKKEKSNR